MKYPGILFGAYSKCSCHLSKMFSISFYLLHMQPEILWLFSHRKVREFNIWFRVPCVKHCNHTECSLLCKSSASVIYLSVHVKLLLEALTAMTLTKSFSPSVSRMVLMVCLAMVSFRPFILPLTSTTMIMSFGDVAAWMYLPMTSENNHIKGLALIWKFTFWVGLQ